MVYVIVLIMTFSISGFFFGFNTPTQSERYNNHILIYDRGLWILKEGNIPFHYLPGDLEELYVDNIAINRIKNSRMIYTTFDPSVEDISVIELVRFELREDLLRIFNVYVADGISEENKSYALPIITCKNATSFVPVLNFVNDNNTGIRIEENCIIIEGEGEDIIKLKDRLVYGLLGVLE